MYSHLERKSENILGWYKVRATWGSLAFAVTIYLCWFCIICIDTWGGRLCESEVALIFHWIYASFLQVIISCRNTLEEPLMLGAIFYPFGLETMYQNQVFRTTTTNYYSNSNHIKSQPLPYTLDNRPLEFRVQAWCSFLIWY